jgi:acid phosphatase (class A)
MRSQSLALCLILALAASRADAQQATVKPESASKFFQRGELDVRLLLAPPPAEGSTAARAELAELHAIAVARTPERLARAQYDAKVENVTAIADVLGAKFDLERLPKTAKLFDDLRKEERFAAKAAKKIFNRPRPWETDPSLSSAAQLAACDKGAPMTSYPSGHATMGWAAGEMLAILIPTQAQEILSRSDDYAESRLVCGVHYRRDIEASHVLATAVITRLMALPVFQTEVEDARSELTSAHLAP